MSCKGQKKKWSTGNAYNKLISLYHIHKDSKNIILPVKQNSSHTIQPTIVKFPLKCYSSEQTRLRTLPLRNNILVSGCEATHCKKIQKKIMNIINNFKPETK